VALFLIGHFKFKPRVIFSYLLLVITIVIVIALSFLVAVALITLGWDDDSAVLKASVPFECVELDRVEVVEYVYP
jgi:hypothetical protein